MKIGFYYSHSQDWNNPGGAKSGLKEGEGWDDAHKGDYYEYLKTVAVPQTRYPIDILWWDTPMLMTPQRAAPFAALAKLRLGLIMNNRLGGGFGGFGGGTATPDSSCWSQAIRAIENHARRLMVTGVTTPLITTGNPPPNSSKNLRTSARRAETFC